MSFSIQKKPTSYTITHLILISTVLFLVTVPFAAHAETLGFKDAQGNFVPKLTVSLSPREVTIKKVDPQEKIKSLSIVISAKNKNLIRNIGHINIEWIDAANKPSKAVQFAGPLYNTNTRTFQDSLTKSIGIRLTDKSARNLLAAKTTSDLFELFIDDQLLLSSETVTEKDRTVQMGAGRDVSINVDKTSINFNESNFKKGEIVNIDNRSGLDQTLGVEVPEKGLLYFQLVKKHEQAKIPRENWERFTLPADSGIFIVLIPEPDPVQLAQLEGKDLVIKVYQGTKIRETRKIPIRVASDLRGGRTEVANPNEQSSVEAIKRPIKQVPVAQTNGSAESATATKSEVAAQAVQTTTKDVRGSMWIWILLLANFLLLAVVSVYGFFFLLPKLQVLQDRISKCEMFLHSSREAIREELDQLKKEIVGECESRIPHE